MSKGWYSVIDYDKCVGCMVCNDMCKHGVYKPDEETNKPKVAFVCVYNSCRSQIAETLGKKLASDVFESYSAGTELKDHINPEAVRMMKLLHNVDMERTQYNKLIADIPEPDVVIFMGCNVSCPNVPSQYAENWGLDDPSGKSDDIFEQQLLLSLPYFARKTQAKLTCLHGNLVQPANPSCLD